MNRRERIPVLTGSMTALVTPFRNGDVDWAALSSLVERQTEDGTDWLVPCGTTGETPTLTHGERNQLLDTVIAAVDGRCPPAEPDRPGQCSAAKPDGTGRCRVMAGTGSNCTADTVEMSKAAASAGADAVLVVTPYYNRPTQEGMFRHFAAVAEAVSLPIVLYNVPGRTGVNLSNETVARLRAEFPHIAALKDASGVVDGVTDLLQRCEIIVLCGDDVLTWPMMALGASGVISVLSNIDPKSMKSLVAAASRGDTETALAYHRRVCSLAGGLGRWGPNPVPIKTAMAVAGLISEEFRLPLCPLDADGRRAVERLLVQHDLAGKAVALS